MGRERFIAALESMSQGELKEISKVVNQFKRSKYPNPSDSRRGDLPKAMSRDKMLEFFFACPNRAYLAAQACTFAWGMRQGEIRNAEYLREQQIIVIHKGSGKKIQRTETMPVYPSSVWLAECLEHINYSGAYVRKIWYRVLETLPPDWNYVVDRSVNGHSLHQFTQHSLRHSSITIFHREHRDKDKTQRFARHVEGEFGVTSRYISYSIEDFRDDCEVALGSIMAELEQRFLSLPG